MPPQLTEPRAALRDRYIAYLRSREFRPVLKRVARLPRWRFLVALVAFPTTFGIPISLYQVYRIIGHRKRYRRELIAFAKRAVPLVAYPLMVNSRLLSEPNVIAPGLVIGSFDPEVNGNAQLMAGLAVRILEISMVGAQTPEEEVVEKLMEDEAYTPNRRRRLPEGLTGGREVYAFDLLIVGQFLPGGTAHVPMIPCVAEPGPEGRIEVVPSWVVSDLQQVDRQTS